MIPGPGELLEALFREAVQAVDLVDRTRQACAALDLRGGPCAAVGKAAAAMAEGAARAGGQLALVVLPHGAAPPPASSAVGELIFAAHPVPDQASGRAGERLLALADRCHARGERLTLLLSGGASALACAPAPPLTVDDKAALTRALLGSGAGIGELNTVRRQLSRLKGGRLAARCAVDLIHASDVLDDDPATIGSGPASADPTGPDAALEVLARRLGAGWEKTGPELGAVHRLLLAGPRPPPADAAALATVRTLGVASHRHLREAATRAALARGAEVLSLGPPVHQEVDEVADRYLEEITQRVPPGATRILVGGGEPTVAVPRGTDLSAARSGRSAHLCLRLARGLAGRSGIAFLSAGSDGIDGFSPAAGAVVDGTTWGRALASGLDPEGALVRYEAAPLLAALGCAVTTGPTGRNLCDLHLLALATP